MKKCFYWHQRCWQLFSKPYKQLRITLKAGANRTTCCPTNQTYTCKCPFIFYKKTFKVLRFRHLNRKEKTFEFKFHVGQHVGLHHKPHQHVILARFYKFVAQYFLIFKKLWPTFFLHFFLRQHVSAQSKSDQHVGQLMLVEMLPNMLSGLRLP